MPTHTVSLSTVAGYPQPQSITVNVSAPSAPGAIDAAIAGAAELLPEVPATAWRVESNLPLAPEAEA